MELVLGWATAFIIVIAICVAIDTKQSADKQKKAEQEKFENLLIEMIRKGK